MSDDTDLSTPARRPVARRLRFEILRRDNYTCRYCGASAPDVPLTVDHVIPIALGGGDDPRNLVTACRDCNSGKGSTSPDEHIVEDVDATAFLFARAAERAAQIRRAQIHDFDLVCNDFRNEWIRIFTVDSSIPYTFDASLRAFMGRGLTYDELIRFISVAATSRAPMSGVWKYFCGCCWREIGDREELARRLIEDGKV